MAAPAILRYPYAALTDSTDYLQIDLIARQFNDTTNPLNNLTKQRTNQGSVYRPQTTSIIPENKNFKVATQINQNIGIIILPMPSSINDTNQVSYSEDNLDAITAKIAGVANDVFTTNLFQGKDGALDLTKALEEIQKKVGGKIKDTDFSAIRSLINVNLASQAASLAGLGNLTLNQALARSSGQIINPNVELLFNGPTIRNFRFSFKMTPRNKDEANQIKLIIRALKKHMSPQLGEGEQIFLKAPNIFELRYKNGRQNNKFLNRFKQCVLENMSVNYTGENVYATYEDGSPVSTVIDLTFKELEPIYSSDYETSEGKEGVGF